MTNCQKMVGMQRKKAVKEEIKQIKINSILLRQQSTKTNYRDWKWLK